MVALDSCRNLAELQRLQSDRLGRRPALRYKRHGLYHDLSWESYRQGSLACAAALVAAGVQPGDRVGLISENRLEWLIADLGIAAAGAVNVSPHDPLTASQIRYQLIDADVSWAFVSTREQLQKLRQVRDSLPAIRGVVVFDSDVSAADAVTWPRFVAAGRAGLPRCRYELLRREQRIGRDDLATIMYTSGTTGEPKGVMLTHGNLLSNAFAVLEVFPMQADTVMLNWLPLSHIYARTVDHYLSLASGALLCLAESAETLVQNIDEVQPTSLSSVPRFYEKLMASLGHASPEEMGRRLRRIFGNRIDWLGSGGAPLPPALARVYRDAGFPVLQGYGLTESSPVITFNRKEHYKLESVGTPLPGVEVRIAADGEILTRGPHIMKGYWKQPAATAAAMTDGWLRTGDLGELDSDGFLTITGRKKDLLILSSGKKIVPAQVEGLLVADPYIDQAVVYGEGRNFLSAVIVPNVENMHREVMAHTANPTVDENMTCDTRVREVLAKRIANALCDLAPWERVKRFIVRPHPFTIEADEMTVSMKLRRAVILEKHRAELEALYREDQA